MFKKTLIIVISLALLFVVGYTPAVNADSDVLVIGSAAEAVGLDPRLETDIPSSERLNIIMEPLVTFGASMDLEPRLATEWGLSEDSLTMTFHLREGVLWHDGEPFTAEDVVYTFEWILDENNAAPNRALYEVIDEVVAENDHTVHFHLAEPNAFLLNNIARMPVVPTAHGDGEDFRTDPIGTGPYSFESWTRDDVMHLVANDDYWGGTPILSRIEFRAIPEDSSRLLALEAGEIDMYQGGVVPEELARLEGDPNVTVQRVTGTGHVYLGFNTRTEPLDDVNVRRAISHLINRAGIIDRIQHGIGSVATGPVPEGLPWYNPDVTTYDYNPQRAQELIEEAGVDLSGLTLGLHTNENPLRIRISEIMQNEAQQIGLDLDVSIEEWGAFWSGLQQPDHEYDLFIVGWVGQVDADRAMFRQFHTDGPFNFGGYSDARLDELLEEGKRVPSDSERSIEIYREAQEIVANNAYYGFINYYEEVGLSRPGVDGYIVHPYTANAWQNAHTFTKE